MTAPRPAQDLSGPTLRTLIDEGLKRVGKSYVWLADKCGISASTLSHALRRNSTSPPTLARIAKWLRIDVEDLAAVTGHSVDAIRAAGDESQVGLNPRTVLEFVDELIPQIARTISQHNRPADAEEQAERLVNFLNAAKEEAPDYVEEIERRQAQVRVHEMGSLRETRLARDSRGRSPLIVASTAPLEHLDSIDRHLRDPQIEARIHLARGQMLYVCGKSDSAIHHFREAMKVSSLLSDDEILLTLRTMALAAAYAGYEANTVQEGHRRLVRNATDRVWRRIEAGKYTSQHNAMTALEGVARASGLIKLRKRFDRSMEEADRIDTRLRDKGVIYELPCVQRHYARLTVYAARAEWSEFIALADEAAASVNPDQYPRHWKQIQEIADKHLNKPWRRSRAPRGGAASRR